MMDVPLLAEISKYTGEYVRCRRTAPTPGLVLGSHGWGFHGFPKALVDAGEGKEVPQGMQSCA